MSLFMYQKQLQLKKEDLHIEIQRQEETGEKYAT